MSGSWSPDPTGRHQVRWWDGSAWTDHVSDDGVAGTDPMSQPTPPPAPEVPPPPGGPPVAAPTGPAAGRSKVPWIVAAVVIVAAGIGAYVVFAGGEDDEGSGDAAPAAPDPEATEPDATEPTTEPADGLAATLGPLIEEAELADDCPLLAEDTESVTADLGAVTSISSGPDEVILDDGPAATAYCNLSTDAGLVSVSAVVTDLDAVDYLDEYFANREPPHEGELSGQGYDPELEAASSGSLAGTCLTESAQYGEQCLYSWSDGTVVLTFADVGADLGQDEAFAFLDQYVASVLDRFGD